MIRLRPQRRRLWWLALLASGAALLLVCFWLAKTPGAEFLTSPPSARPSRFAFLNQWIAPVRPALQRLKWRLAGPPRGVSLGAEVFECGESFDASGLSLPTAVLSNGAGLQIWLLGTNEVQAVRQRLEQRGRSISNGGLWSGDEKPSKLRMANSIAIAGAPRNVGLELDVLPRTRGSSVDLAWFLTSTEAVTNKLADFAATNRLFLRTNAAIGARVLIPMEQSLFVLDKIGANGKRMAVIISPTIHEPGK